MNTFAFLGTPEIIIILVIALIVFGPQKLPEIGKQVGAAMRELRKMSGDVQRALDIDDHGSSYGGYDSGRWFDPAPSTSTPTAPSSPVVASAEPLAISASGTAEADLMAPSGLGVSFVDPPGPPARVTGIAHYEPEEPGHHTEATGTKEV